MHLVKHCAILAAMLLAGANRVEADLIFDVTGTFGLDIGEGYTGLAGGSSEARQVSPRSQAGPRNRGRGRRRRRTGQGVARMSTRAREPRAGR
jgi:hypothetical protein